MKQKVIKFSTMQDMDKYGCISSMIFEGKLIEHDKENYYVIFKGAVITFNRTNGISLDNKYILVT